MRHASLILYNCYDMNSLETGPGEIARAAELLSGHPDYRVVVRYRRPDEGYGDLPPTEKRHVCAVVDTETTGLSAGADKIIELGILLVEYSSQSLSLGRIVGEYAGFEDPGSPLPESIVKLTGISDDALKGQSFRDAEVNDLAGRANLVIAHNAGFDHPFLAQRFPAFCELPWACSMVELPWSEWGFASSKLDYLGYRFGRFHEGHRALNDCESLLDILARPAPAGSGTLFSRLVESARKPSSRIWAIGAPYERKDDLKARGYSWNDGTDRRPKAWWIDVHDSREEEAYLAAMGARPKIEELTAYSRYQGEAARTPQLAATRMKS